MGTRGAYGFHTGRTDKVAYNHYDSYPSGLGADVAQFICDTSDDELRAIARKIKLVIEDGKPTPEQIEKYRRYANTGVAFGDVHDWYVLLRETQGDLIPYRDDGLDVMIDNAGFLLDSLFCEYAYISNVSTGALETYVGFQKSPGPGRYGDKKTNPDADYYGVRLVDVRSWDEVRRLGAKGCVEEIEAICAKEQS